MKNTTRQKIEEGRIPTNRDLERKRGDVFKERVRKTLENRSLDFFSTYLEELQQELGLSMEELTPALLFLAQKGQPLQVRKNSLDVKPVEKSRPKEKREQKSPAREASPPNAARREKKDRRPLPESKFDCYRLEVGKQHDIKPADIVGAIANEVDLDSRFIGRIKLFDDHSTVELPEGMPKAIFNHLKKVHIKQKKINPSLITV